MRRDSLALEARVRKIERELRRIEDGDAAIRRYGIPAGIVALVGPGLWFVRNVQIETLMTPILGLSLGSLLISGITIVLVSRSNRRQVDELEAERAELFRQLAGNAPDSDTTVQLPRPRR